MGVVRTMELKDVKAVAALEKQLNDPAWPVEAFLQAMGYGQYCAVLEDESGEIIGFGVADKGHGRNIACATPSAAGALYRAWFDYCVAQGVDLLWAEIGPENDAARSRLARFGFTLAGVRSNFYGVGLDAQVWQKTLSKSREDQNS